MIYNLAMYHYPQQGILFIVDSCITFLSRYFTKSWFHGDKSSVVHQSRTHDDDIVTYVAAVLKRVYRRTDENHVWPSPPKTTLTCRTHAAVCGFFESSGRIKCTTTTNIIIRVLHNIPVADVRRFWRMIRTVFIRRVFYFFTQSLLTAAVMSNH